MSFLVLDPYLQYNREIPITDRFDGNRPVCTLKPVNESLVGAERDATADCYHNRAFIKQNALIPRIGMIKHLVRAQCIATGNLQSVWMACRPDTLRMAFKSTDAFSEVEMTQSTSSDSGLGSFIANSKYISNLKGKFGSQFGSHSILPSAAKGRPVANGDWVEVFIDSAIDVITSLEPYATGPWNGNQVSPTECPSNAPKGVAPCTDQGYYINAWWDQMPIFFFGDNGLVLAYWGPDTDRREMLDEISAHNAKIVADINERKSNAMRNEAETARAKAIVDSANAAIASAQPTAQKFSSAHDDFLELARQLYLPTKPYVDIPQRPWTEYETMSGNTGGGGGAAVDRSKISLDKWSTLLSEWSALHAKAVDLTAKAKDAKDAKDALAAAKSASSEVQGVQTEEARVVSSVLASHIDTARERENAAASYLAFTTECVRVIKSGMESAIARDKKAAEDASVAGSGSGSSGTVKPPPAAPTTGNTSVVGVAFAVAIVGSGGLWWWWSSQQN